jgi:hypothetical protein
MSSICRHRLEAAAEKETVMTTWPISMISPADLLKLGQSYRAMFLFSYKELFLVLQFTRAGIHGL